VRESLHDRNLLAARSDLELASGAASNQMQRKEVGASPWISSGWLGWGDFDYHHCLLWPPAR